MKQPLEKREKAIVCIMYTILRPDIQHLDFNKKIEALHGLLISCDIHLTDGQIEEIVYLCNDVMVQGQGGAKGKIKQHYQELAKKLGINLDLAKIWINN